MTNGKRSNAWSSGRWGEFKPGTANKIPFPDSHFQLVVLGDGVAELGYSASEKLDVIKEVARVLKPGGKVLLTDFTHPRNFSSYIEDLRSPMFTQESVYYFKDRLWFQLATNLKNFQNQAWCRWLLKSRSLAKMLEFLSGWMGRNGSKHIGVLLKKSQF